MTINFERVFHPVGQGAFYSEKHTDFNVVYDCGNWRNSKAATNVVNDSFLKKDIIDVLFISHFDFDHVSKIRTLSNKFRINVVVMPLLSDDEKCLLTNIYRVLNNRVLNLINKPEKFFGDGTSILKVAPFIEKNDEAELNYDDVKGLNGKVINSGSVINMGSKSYSWKLIPYNYESKSRRVVLEEALLKEGFSTSGISKLKSDSKYTLKSIKRDVGLSASKNGKIFRKVYNSLTGGINQNSMLLFSGVTNTTKLQICQDINYKLKNPMRFESDCVYWKRALSLKEEARGKVSCIYTGDSDLNLVKIKTIFSEFWDTVGTIQVPHHGSKNNFEYSLLDNEHYYFPISVGIKNTYSHPSPDLVKDIVASGASPVFITDNLSSKFSQKYWV